MPTNDKVFMETSHLIPFEITENFVGVKLVFIYWRREVGKGRGGGIREEGCGKILTKSCLSESHSLVPDGN